MVLVKSNQVGLQQAVEQIFSVGERPEHRARREGRVEEKANVRLHEAVSNVLWRHH